MEHKCKNCGADFDGNFCPNCGTGANTTRACPHCGAEVAADMNFCNNCGMSVEELFSVKDVGVAKLLPTAPKHSGKSHGVLAGITKWLPAVYALVLGVLVFAFMAAPVVSLLGFGTSYYSALTDIMMESYKLSAIFVMVFAAISIAVGITMLILAGKDKHNTWLTLLLSVAVYFSLFVIACVAMSQATNDGMQAGASPILILTFAILGIAVSVVFFLIARKLCGKSNSIPQITVNLNKAIKVFSVMPQFLLATLCAVMFISFFLPLYRDSEYGGEGSYNGPYLCIWTGGGYAFELILIWLFSFIYLMCQIRRIKKILRGEVTNVNLLELFQYFLIYGACYSIVMIFTQVSPTGNVNPIAFWVIEAFLIFCFLLTVASFFALSVCKRAAEHGVEQVTLHKVRPIRDAETVGRKVLRYAPASCTLALALLVFAFMAAPVYSMLGFGENYYTSFNATSTTGDFMAITISTMFFALVGVVYGIVALFRSRNQLKITDYVVMLLLNVVHLIIAAVTMAKVTSQMLEIGAGPILILVFDILFAIGTVVCLIFDLKLKGFAALKPVRVDYTPKTRRFIDIAPVCLMFVLSAVTMIFGLVWRIVIFSSASGLMEWTLLLEFPLLFIVYFACHINYYAYVATDSRKRVYGLEVVMALLLYCPILSICAVSFFVGNASASVLIIVIILLAICLLCIGISLACAFMRLGAKKQLQSDTSNGCDENGNGGGTGEVENGDIAVQIGQTDDESNSASVVDVSDNDEETSSATEQATEKDVLEGPNNSGAYKSAHSDNTDERLAELLEMLRQRNNVSAEPDSNSASKNNGDNSKS